MREAIVRAAIDHTPAGDIPVFYETFVTDVIRVFIGKPPHDGNAIEDTVPPPYDTLLYVRSCAASWEPEARILGNARAIDIIQAIDTAEEERSSLRKALQDLVEILPTCEYEACKSPVTHGLYGADDAYCDNHSPDGYTQIAGACAIRMAVDALK